MIFNSLAFVCFFAVVLCIRLAPLPWTCTKVLLLASSYAFYAAWYPPYLLIVLSSTCVDWWVAKRIARTHAPRRRRALLILSVTLNLGLLALFKYESFAVANFNALAAAFAVPVHLRAPQLVLPIGISFYTFEALSYTVEVYRGKLQPARALVDYGLFIAFFPRMVAGPIMRAGLFLPQCEKRRGITPRDIAVGAALFAWGAFEKIVLADWLLAPISDRVFNAVAVHATLDCWLGTLAFAGQIFFDFAGYSTCAIGISRCLGFVLPCNFNSPYAARDLSEFWQRWHISLSFWLRDYLYTPLGGNRRGSSRTRANLFLTMLLGGLWHGAAWTFVVWGAIHGALLIVQRACAVSVARIATKSELVGAMTTFLCVCIGLIFFRATSLTSAAQIAIGLLGLGSAGPRLLGVSDAVRVLMLTVCMLAAHWQTRHLSLEQVLDLAPRLVRAPALALILVLIVLSPGDDRAFIYFRF